MPYWDHKEKRRKNLRLFSFVAQSTPVALLLVPPYHGWFIPTTHP